VLVSTDATSGSPDGGGTGGNRQTCYIGNAALAAAADLKASIMTDAAEMLGRSTEELVLRDGSVRIASREADRVTFKELYDAGISRRYHGSYHGKAEALDARSQGIPYDAYSYGCQMAEVEVDTRTGRIRVRRITVAHDVGMALNPQAVEGQLHGGVMMGLGFALKEQYVPGKTRDLARYHLPRFSDAPEIRLLPLASGLGKGPFGAVGLGECSLLPTAPAIVNAISNATRVRPRELPVTAASLRDLLTATHARRE
jgi:CO/xanthine dehydrogenase Mo-binding subunit